MRDEEENTGTHQGTEWKSQELPPRAVHPAVTGTAKEGGWEVLKAMVHTQCQKPTVAPAGGTQDRKPLSYPFKREKCRSTDS